MVLYGDSTERFKCQVIGLLFPIVEPEVQKMFTSPYKEARETEEGNPIGQN